MSDHGIMLELTEDIKDIIINETDNIVTIFYKEKKEKYPCGHKLFRRNYPDNTKILPTKQCKLCPNAFCKMCGDGTMCHRHNRFDSENIIIYGQPPRDVYERAVYFTEIGSKVEVYPFYE